MIRVVRLGSPRARGEGLRLGTVRRPPRGVKKADYARRDYYDAWLPELAPSARLIARAAPGLGRVREGVSPRDEGAGRGAPARASRRLSQHADFSVGCYCEDEERCHRSILGSCWRSTMHDSLEPSAWVARWAPLVTRGPVLDVASGAGRHARLFAQRGLAVVAVDREPQSIPGMHFVQADLEDGSPWPFGGQRFGGIVVTNYLHRPLFPELVAVARRRGRADLRDLHGRQRALRQAVESELPAAAGGAAGGLRRAHGGRLRAGNDARRR